MKSGSNPTHSSIAITLRKAKKGGYTDRVRLLDNHTRQEFSENLAVLYFALYSVVVSRVASP